MKKRFEFRMLYFFILLFLLSGCAPSRVYTEGVLAKDYRTMSIDELQRYSVNLQDEIATGGKGRPRSRRRNPGKLPFRPAIDPLRCAAGRSKIEKRCGSKSRRNAPISEAHLPCPEGCFSSPFFS